MSGFSLRNLVAGERCNFTGKYCERGSMSEYIENSHSLSHVSCRILRRKQRILRSLMTNDYPDIYV